MLVIVETDPLPIKLRTDFFTADRSGVRASAEALRLEQDVAGFLRDWDELKKINGELIEQSLHGEDHQHLAPDQPCLRAEDARLWHECERRGHRQR